MLFSFSPLSHKWIINWYQLEDDDEEEGERAKWEWNFISEHISVGSSYIPNAKQMLDHDLQMESYSVTDCVPCMLWHFWWFICHFIVQGKKERRKNYSIFEFLVFCFIWMFRGMQACKWALFVFPIIIMVRSCRFVTFHACPAVITIDVQLCDHSIPS